MRSYAYKEPTVYSRVLEKVPYERTDTAYNLLPPTIPHARLLIRGFGNSNGVLSTALFVSPALSGRPSRLRSCIVNLLILQPNDLNSVLILMAGIIQKDLRVEMVTHVASF